MSDANKKKKRKYLWDSGFRWVIPFFVVLAVLTVVAFILPLRPTQSQMEKRELAEFPEFSVESLLSGDYFDGISTWFSDTFPGREEWVKLSTAISSLHGYSEVSISGDFSNNQIVPEVTEPVEAPTEEATQPPQGETAATEEATQPTETEGWAGYDAEDDLEVDIGGNALVQIGDSVFNTIGFTPYYSEQYAKTVSDFAAIVEEELGITTISAPCPTGIGVLVEPAFLEKLGLARQDEMITYIHEHMAENVVTVDTYGALVSHLDEYIYFRTDHHWTARGAYYAYAAICEARGYDVVPLEAFTEVDMGEFEGSLYWQASNPGRLKMDTLIAYIPQGDIVTTLYNAKHYPFPGELIQDMTEREPNVKYSAFICGDYPMTEIVNNSIPDAPTCVILKDSFGNALAPYLSQCYHRVLVIDYRKFTYSTLKWFLSQNDVDDLIFAPYVIATQDINGNRLFKSLCK